MITETRKNAGGASYEIDRKLEIGRRLTFLVAKARLLAGSNGSAGDYMRAVQKWVAERDDMNVQLDASYQVFQQTSEMIEHRNSRFTTRIDSALSRQKGSPTAKSRDIRPSRDGGPW